MIVAIEGNIGSGKSTLLARLSENVRIHNKPVIFLQEPVDQWESIKDINGNTMLQKFYENQKKYSFSFQMMAYISRLALLKDAVEENPDAIIITERSLYTDRYVFAKMLYDSNKIESVEYQIYLKWFDTFAKDFPITKTIYVKTKPEICHFRIIKRSRNAESTISLDYLQECNNYHNRMIENYCVKSTILELDGNLEIDDMENIWTRDIINFIDTH